MTIVELYQNETIPYLFRKRLVSPAVSTYIDSFIRYSNYRNVGKAYRESVKLLSEECKLSATTIKKASRIIKNSSN